MRLAQIKGKFLRSLSLFTIIAGAFLFLGGAVFSSGCAQLVADGEIEGDVSHVVVVWLKDDVPADYVQLLKKKTRELRFIPGLVNLRVGEAIESDRPIVDDSFDLAIYMEFVSDAALQDYLVNPKHTTFVEEYIKGKTTRLLVYDF